MTTLKIHVVKTHVVCISPRARKGFGCRFLSLYTAGLEERIFASPAIGEKTGTREKIKANTQKLGNNFRFV